MYRFALCFLLAACGGKDSDTGSTDTDTDAADTDGGDTDAADACSALCATGGFTGGHENVYGELVECVCEGSGTGLAQDDCTAYCADLGVAEEFAYLGEDASPNDKCACDGNAS